MSGTKQSMLIQELVLCTNGNLLKKLRNKVFCVEESGFCIGRLSGSELILTSVCYCLVNIISLLFIWGHVLYLPRICLTKDS